MSFMIDNASPNFDISSVLFPGTSVYALYSEVRHDYLAFDLGTLSEVFPNAPRTVDAAEYFHDTGLVYLIKVTDTPTDFCC